MENSTKAEKGWETVYPEGKIAIVDGFLRLFTLPVEKLVLYNGEPERVFGDGHKVKMCEEPFMILGEDEKITILQLYKFLTKD